MKKVIYLFLLCVLTMPFLASAQTNNNAHYASNQQGETTRKQLLIPNAFSPNNDGQNDYFKISNITDEKLIDFKVFNRWGTILYRTNDPKAGWDGTFKNQPQPVGVYGYVIRIGYSDGYVETYKGTVTLLK